MPLVVKQALAVRLSSMPELHEMLADIGLLTGVQVRFQAAADAPEPGGATDHAAEPVALCGRLRREETGCRYCVSFRQKLREQATQAPATATCDAGLRELLVPIVVGGVVAGHLLVAGLREGPPGTAADNRARHLLGRVGVPLRPEEIARLRAQAPALDPARLQALARLLQAGAERIARAIQSHLAHAPAGVPELIERAYRIVHADHARALRVPLIARRLGVSPAHLSRTFHQATGLRLVDYLGRYRAERARTLLIETERPITEIARASGFASISQFNRVFRATFGASPRKIRDTDTVPRGSPEPVD